MNPGFCHFPFIIYFDSSWTIGQQIKQPPYFAAWEQTLSMYSALHIQLADSIVCPHLDSREISCIYIASLH